MIHLPLFYLTYGGTHHLSIRLIDASSISFSGHVGYPTCIILFRECITLGNHYDNHFSTLTGGRNNLMLYMMVACAPQLQVEYQEVAFDTIRWL
jgi:hypothetical protein